MYIYIYIYIYVCVCIYICVCVILYLTNCLVFNVYIVFSTGCMHKQSMRELSYLRTP